MVTVAYNEALRTIQDGFVKQLSEAPVLANDIGFVDLTGAEDDREHQFDYLNSTVAARIGDEYSWLPHADDWQPFKAPNKLIETNLAFPRRFIDGNRKAASAVQQIQDDKVDQHGLVRDEFLIWGDTRFQQFAPLGAKVSNANSSINKPSSCESTPGTTETVSGGFFGGNRGTMMAQVLDTTVKNLFLGKVNTGNGKRLVSRTGAMEILCLIHPMAYGYLDSAMYDGSKYLEKTSIEYLQSRGWRFQQTILADSDYAGADDGTTTLLCFADPSRLFKLGVLKRGAWDNGGQWWADDAFTEYRQRFSEILTGYAIPFYDGTYYYKGFLEATITPFDSAA